MLRLMLSQFLIERVSPFKLWVPVLILVRISCCKAFSVLIADRSVDGARSKARLQCGRASDGLFNASIARDIAYAHSNALGRRTDARAAKSYASDGSCDRISYHSKNVKKRAKQSILSVFFSGNPFIWYLLIMQECMKNNYSAMLYLYS